MGRSGKDSVVLGVFGAAHLGDVLCSSPLPRQLSIEKGCTVYVTDLPVTRAVFANHPHVAGFTGGPAISLDTRSRGSGHVIQRLLQGFELNLDLPPRPELYFSQEELAWAATERATWTTSRPVCIISARAFTDASHINGLDWLPLCRILSENYTIVQPIMSKRSVYESQIAGLGHHHWGEEPVVPGAVIYRDLPLRRYLSLFTAANLFVGPPSGGSHAAAALNVPSVIVIWNDVQKRLRFPIPEHQKSVDMFLYPQHCFVNAEDIRADEPTLRDKLKPLLSQVRVFESTESADQTICPHPWQVKPRNPQRIVLSRSRRLLRMPGIYGDGSAATPWEWQ